MILPSLLALMLGGTLAGAFLAFATGEPVLAALLGGVALTIYLYGVAEGADG